MNIRIPFEVILSLFVTGLFLVPFFPTYALTANDVDVLLRNGVITKENEILARQVVDITQAQAGDLANTEGIYFNTGANNQAVTTNVTSETGEATQSCSNLSTDLVVGMSGAAVTKLQEYLKEKGHFTFPRITGYYGNVTKEAVQSFQRTEGIVSSGTPETTGYGIVGPRTRETINKLLCTEGIGTTGNGTVDPDGYILGYDLDDLFNSYDSDFSYDSGQVDNFSSDFVSNFTYDPGEGFDSNFDYDADLDFVSDSVYDSGPGYESNFGYESSSFDEAGDPIRVRIGSKDAQTDKVFYGEGKRMYVESKSRTVNVTWDSRNADTCALSGSFFEGELVVPENGDANVFLVNPIGRYSGQEMRDAIQTDIEEEQRAIAIANGTYEPEDDGNDFFYDSGAAFDYNSDVETRPVFAISIYCRDEQRFGNTASDTIYIHLDEDAVQAEQNSTNTNTNSGQEGTAAPKISGITPDSGRFGSEIFVIGTNFATQGNTVTITPQSGSGSYSLQNIVPSTNGSLRFTFPSAATLSSVTGNYTITITSNSTSKVSNSVSFRVQ